MSGGFIARAGGELDWLEAAKATVPEGEDCGYHAFMESVDTLVGGEKPMNKSCLLVSGRTETSPSFLSFWEVESHYSAPLNYEVDSDIHVLMCPLAELEHNVATRTWPDLRLVIALAMARAKHLLA